MQRRLYFGHPINVYGTPLEAALLARVSRGFREWEIVDPNRPEHDEGYARYRRETGSGMEYYLREVLPGCRGGVFLPFRDGAWGAGVFLEAKAIQARSRRRCIWVVDWRGRISRADLSAVRVLTVDETRARVRGEGGSVIPY